MPKISIVTATYNRPELLERMIASVLEQTFTDWELIIIDDSTNDATKEFMSRYENNPKIIYLKNKENKGLPDSRNRGLDTTCGEWITFLDDDDLYVNDGALANVAKFLQEKQPVWLVCNTVNPSGTQRTQAKENKTSFNWLNDFLFGKEFGGDSVHFFHKNIVENIRYSGPHRAEWQFWYQLSQTSNFTYQPINVVQVEYLPHGMSNLGYLKKERIYQGQQFREMIQHISTWKYLPTIALRYVASFVLVRKIRNLLRAKQAHH